MDAKLGRDVAIKVLPEAVARDPERLARFEREAKVLASLNHPNIAAIYSIESAMAATQAGHDSDRDEAGREPIRFLVLELIEGDDLAQRLDRGPIKIGEALPISLQIAEALETAHESGVVHRDLKPANVKVTPGGQVKVLDFGLAKALETAPSAEQDDSQGLGIRRRAHTRHRNRPVGLQFPPAPAVSSGRRALLVPGAGQRRTESKLRIRSLTGSTDKEIIQTSTQGEFAAGFLLFTRGNTLMAQRFDAEPMDLSGEATPLVSEILTIPGAALGIFSNSGSWVLAYNSGNLSQQVPLEWRDREGNPLGTVGERILVWSNKQQQTETVVNLVVNWPVELTAE